MNNNHNVHSGSLFECGSYLHFVPFTCALFTIYPNCPAIIKLIPFATAPSHFHSGTWSRFCHLCSRQALSRIFNHFSVFICPCSVFYHSPFFLCLCLHQRPPCYPILPVSNTIFSHLGQVPAVVDDLVQSVISIESRTFSILYLPVQ